jgi:aminoglycoside phosphotransferase (APT) family kinase protein
MSNALSNPLQQYLAERYPGGRISDFQFLTSGWESEVYTFSYQFRDGALKPFVLRLYPGEGARQKLIREAQGLLLLRQAGNPVPAMLLYETDTGILGKPFTILEKLEGKVLWPLLYEVEPSEADHLLNRFGGLLARLHQLDWRPFTGQAAAYQAQPEAILDNLLTGFRQLYTQFDVLGFLPLLDWLDTHQAGITVRPAVVHLDFHANNVFVCADGHLAVIDWTQIAVSDYRTDLTWTLMIMGDFGQPGWGERILHAYRRAASYPVEGLDYFNVITYTKLLASTIISLKTSPKELGMRPETALSVNQQVPILRKLSQRIQDITGLTVPEVRAALSQASAVNRQGR